MKIRSGFVSNSSSSSFVVIGVTFNDGELKHEDFLKACKVKKSDIDAAIADKDGDMMHDLLLEQTFVFSDNSESGGNFAGLELASVDSDGCDGLGETVIDLAKVQKQVKVFVANLSIKDKTIKLITGSRMS